MNIISLIYLGICMQTCLGSLKKPIVGKEEVMETEKQDFSRFFSIYFYFSISLPPPPLISPKKVCPTCTSRRRYCRRRRFGFSYGNTRPATIGWAAACLRTISHRMRWAGARVQ